MVGLARANNVAIMLTRFADFQAPLLEQEGFFAFLRVPAEHISKLADKLRTIAPLGWPPGTYIGVRNDALPYIELYSQLPVISRLIR